MSTSQPIEQPIGRPSSLSTSLGSYRVLIPSILNISGSWVTAPLKSQLEDALERSIVHPNENTIEINIYDFHS
jgi:hypothetical protein